MDYRGIIISGTSGSGKSTIAKMICDLSDHFEVVKAITTRQKRDDDYNYEYVTDAEFEKKEQKGDLIITTKYRNKKYAITNEHLTLVFKSGKIPILIISPESVERFVSKMKDEFNFLSFYIDTIDDELTKRLTEREIDTAAAEKEIKQRNIDRQYSKFTVYNLLNREEELDSICKFILELWKIRSFGGVLPHQLLQMFLKHTALIESESEISKENISASSFDLTLGNSYFQNGQIRSLKDEEPNIIIKPGDFIIAGSRERVNIPTTLVGRFDLTVSMFCRGLILSNGPQVDPGYSGPLFCLLFNTSNEKIELKKGQHYATIEFSKMIYHTDKPYNGRYQNKEKIFEYLPETAKYSVISQVRDDISKLQKESFWLKYLPLIIAIASLAASIFKLVKP